MKHIHLVYFEWENTANNHAGMSYLANKLCQDIPNIQLHKLVNGRIKLIRILNVFYSLYLAIYFRIQLKLEDKVFLMEYLAPSSFQSIFAKTYRAIGGKNEITGLVHLAGSQLMTIYKKKTTISRKMKYIDRCVVFGSSLSEFLRKDIGFSNVATTFHYVENDYYYPDYESIYKAKEELRIIVMGNTMRNIPLLRNIVHSLSTITFDICQGKNNWSVYFEDCKNVRLHNYISEDNLRTLMQHSDISLSVMEDTIGSNVIVTSLATGLISVASDVGSIRDYLSTEESFLCKSESDFVSSIHYIEQHKQDIPLLRKKAIERSKLFTYPEFTKEFKSIFSLL